MALGTGCACSEDVCSEYSSDTVLETPSLWKKKHSTRVREVVGVGMQAMRLKNMRLPCDRKAATWLKTFLSYPQLAVHVLNNLDPAWRASIEDQSSATRG
jgi:hypothetical protein